MPPLWTRKAVVLACAVVVPASVIAALQVDDPYAIVVLMAFAMFGIGMQMRKDGARDVSRPRHGQLVIGSGNDQAGAAGHQRGQRVHQDQCVHVEVVVTE